MPEVFFLVSRKNENVVQVDNNEVVQVVVEEVVHEALEGGGGISEAKGHH